jgi:hypothetical protein
MEAGMDARSWKSMSFHVTLLIQLPYRRGSPDLDPDISSGIGFPYPTPPRQSKLSVMPAQAGISVFEIAVRFYPLEDSYIRRNDKKEWQECLHIKAPAQPSQHFSEQIKKPLGLVRIPAVSSTIWRSAYFKNTIFLVHSYRPSDLGCRNSLRLSFIGSRLSPTLFLL